MKKTKRSTRLSAFLLALGMLLISLAVLAVPAGAEGSVVTHTVDLNEYIVFDLASSSVKIKKSTYSGSYYVKTDGGWALTAKNTSATRNGSEKFYVLQSSCATVTIDGDILTVTYTNIDNAEMINKTDVTDVMNKWAAAATGRTSTSNYIHVSDSAGIATDLTIDNVWSTMQRGSSSYNADGNGGVDIHINKTENMQVSLKLRGDNRLSFFYYACEDIASSGLTVSDDPADDATAPEPGSLTVIGNDATASTYAGASYYNNAVSKNNWQSVIGNLDSGSGNVYNFSFVSGVIYAGAHETENCTAIGGGGNGFGEIMISGTAVVTAVTHSTGAAIGGGIAHTSLGGAADVTISGGEVYAYNFGVNAYDRITSTNNKTNYGTTDTKVVQAARHIPGTAIGGGSSILREGAQATVTITGGKVYAESLGGSALGGGNSINGVGGIATVNLQGGEVEAISSSADIVCTTRDKVTVHVPTGTAIGGGSSKIKAGGDAEVTITGGNTLATGIGGGGSMYQAGGDSDVTMQDGTVVSTGMGGGFSETLGFAQGEVTVIGGSLNSAMSAIPQDENGNALYLTRVSWFHNAETVANTKVSELLFRDSSTVYAHEQIYTDSVGMIYLWLPEGAALLSGKLANDDAATYTPNNEADADIDANDVGALLYETEQPRYIVNIAGSGYYSLYFDEAMTANFSGAVIWPQGEFTYYIQAKAGVALTPYVGTTDADGNKVLTPGRDLEPMGDNLYRSTIRVDADMKVWYLVTVGDQSYFSLDLNNGNVSITEKDGTLTIEQGGYKLIGNHEIYLTSAGFPTDNKVTIKSESEGTPSDIYITAGDLNINVSDTAIRVESGSVYLCFDEHDNAINSSGASPIVLASDRASLHIDSKNIESLRITSSGSNPVVKGPGELSLDNQGGFLYLSPKGDAAQVCVGTYQFTGQNKKLDTELYKSEGYSYDLIGYLSGGTLYPSDVDPDSITSGGASLGFKASGIRATYRGITPGAYTVSSEENAFYLPISIAQGYSSIGMIQVIDATGADVTDQVQILTTNALDGATSATLAISGDLFLEGHITVYAAANNLIPYEIFSYNNAYDAQGHGITVQVSRDFKVTYSYTLSGVEYVSTTNPTFTDVGEYRVFVTIEEIVVAGEEPTYDTVTGVFGTVTITRAKNGMEEDIYCPHLIQGSGEPTPSATAKFGDPVFYYYSDAQGENAIDDVSALVAGTYYVRAVIEGTPNYEGYVFDLIRFEVIEKRAYALTGRHLGQVKDLSGATTGTLQLPPKASFTVYYETVSTGNDHLSFTAPLPAGVKITLVSFDVVGAASYYYYITTGETTDLAISSFKGMGATNTYVCVADMTAHYQLCFEGENLPDRFDIKLNNSDDFKLSFEVGLAYSAGFADDEMEIVEKDGTWQISVRAQAYAADVKLMAFSVTPTAGGAIPVLRAELYSQSSAVPLPLTYSNGNLLIFRIADGATSVNGKYTLVLHNLSAGSYTVTADIRILGKNDISTAYVLDQRTAQNHLFATATYAADTTAPCLHAELVEGSRVTQRGATLSFKLMHTATMSDSATVTILRRQNDGSYATVQDPVAVALTPGEGNTATTEAITIPVGMATGTYRIRFEYGGAVYLFNIILRQ